MRASTLEHDNRHTTGHAVVRVVELLGRATAEALDRLGDQRAVESLILAFTSGDASELSEGCG